MIYPYKCEKCGEIVDVVMGMMEEHPKSIECKQCGGKAYRYYGMSKVIVPEHFKAMNELYNNNSASDFSYISDRMRHGTRISGKQRSHY